LFVRYGATNVLLLLLVWQAPLGVCSAKCRRQSTTEWTILSHSYRRIQEEIVGPQI